MDRERGEAYLRLLAEAELRATSTDVTFARMRWAALALDSVRVLDAGTAEAIIGDHAVALGARRRSSRGLIMDSPPWLPRGPWRAPWSAWPALGSQAGSAPPRPAGSRRPGQARLVPLGLRVRYFHDGTERELHLLSYSRTVSGARFTVAWPGSSHAVSSGNPLPFGPVQITDNRRDRYSLSLAGAGGADPVGEMTLYPDPPDDVQWFELAPPGGPARRIDVGPGVPPGGICPRVRRTGLSAGEHLLNQSAERLLVSSLYSSINPRRRWSDDLAAWLGEVVAALEGAGVLSPASPVPGRIAALCARLGITRHGITAPPAGHLPGPWLSLLAYQHRKPPPPPAWDGFAAVAAALPELNGITLTLLGVLSLGAKTVLYLRASGDGGPGRPPDQDIPLSVWVRGSHGRWHLADLRHWSHDDHEHVLTMDLIPPLSTFEPRIGLLAAGPSAEVSARLPLRWQ